MLKFTPELIIAKYIKSATNGRIISIRLRRVLTLIILPLWIGGACWSGIMTYQGIDSIFKSKALEKRIQEIPAVYSPNSGLGRFIQPPYVEAMKMDLFVLKDKKDLIWYFPAFIIIGFIVPWIIMRLVYWIIDVDKEEV